MSHSGAQRPRAEDCLGQALEITDVEGEGTGYLFQGL